MAWTGDIHEIDLYIQQIASFDLEIDRTVEHDLIISQTAEFNGDIVTVVEHDLNIG